MYSNYPSSSTQSRAPTPRASSQHYNAQHPPASGYYQPHIGTTSGGVYSRPTPQQHVYTQPRSSTSYPHGQRSSTMYPHEQQIPNQYSEDDYDAPLSNVRGGQGKTMFEEEYQERPTIVNDFQPAGHLGGSAKNRRDSPKRKEPPKRPEEPPKRLDEPPKRLDEPPKQTSVGTTTKTIHLGIPVANKKAKTDKDEERQKNWKAADGWVKQGASRQDQISHNYQEFVKRFEGYVEIKPHEYSDIQPGTPIRYMKHNPNAPFKYDYRAGGVLVRNGYPDYWVLKPYDGRGKNWSVPLKGESKYFRKDEAEQKRVHTRNAKLMEKVEAGDLLIIDKDAFAVMKKENEELQQLKTRLKDLERTSVRK